LEIVSLETVIELLKLNVHCTKHSIWVKNPYHTVLIDVGNLTLIQINQILMEPKNLKSFPCHSGIANSRISNSRIVHSRIVNSRITNSRIANSRIANSRVAITDPMVCINFTT
jgi:hypothetical protein